MAAEDGPPAPACVVVDYRSGPAVADCVRSLRADGAADVVVVDNGGGTTAAELGPDAGATVVATGRNLGYGAGANRGVAAGSGPGAPEVVLVCNPDLVVHPGALAALARALDDHPAWAVAGPRILAEDGTPYPSVRPFPTLLDAVGHAAVGFWRPDNAFTRRYRPAPPTGDEPTTAGWVSGACLALRRRAFEELGGFDEAYFMFAEDMDLCWRAHRAGWEVGYVPAAVVTHTQGVSTRAHPYRMLAAHHRSALRFAVRTTTGWRRALLPLGALVLGLRLAAAWAAQAVGRGGR